MENNSWSFLLSILFVTCFFLSASSQVSVYSCDAINSLSSQSEIDNAGYIFYKPCISVDNYLMINGTYEKKLEAISEISLSGDYHVGNFNGNSHQWLKINEEPRFDVVLLNDNYSDLNSVLKFKKLELGINITGDLLERINNFINPGSPSNLDALNPFLEKDLDIGFKFTHVATGTVKLMDAFYYEEFIEASDWVKVSNPYPIRARFAPPLVGKWKVEIFVEYRENFSSNWHWEKLPDFYFNVIESGHPGFVKVHSNHKNFERGGQIIFPFGHTLPAPYNGVNIYSPVVGNTNKAASVENWQQYRGDVENYISQGGKFLKTTQTAYSSLVEFEEKGNYYNRLHYAWEQDKILDLCEEHDILLLFNLLFQEPIMSVGQYTNTSWDFGHWDILGQNNINEAAIPYCYYADNKEPYEMFMNNPNVQYDDIYFHQQRTRYYISRYGYSPQIYNFELLSEPWHLNESYFNDQPKENFANDDDWYKAGIQTSPYIDGSHDLHDSVRIALWNYHDKISKFIKEHLYHTDHLIGIQSFTASAKYPWIDENNTVHTDYSTLINTIDVVGINRYDVGPNKLLITEKHNHNNLTPADENSYYKMIKQIHEFCAKPVIYSEAGTETSCDALFTQQTETMTLGFTGVAGGHYWAGYSYDDSNPLKFDERLLWPITIHCANFYNENTFLDVLSNTNGYWVQGRQSEKRDKDDDADSKEIQYYLAEDRNDGVGYIRNRTYNDISVSNCNDSIDPTWENVFSISYNTGKPLDILGMNSNIDYNFHWYSFQNTPLNNTNDHSNGAGKIKKIKHPVLDGANYLVWFRIKRDYSQRNDSTLLADLGEYFAFDDKFTIYPNPASQKIYVTYNGVCGKLTILNNAGSIVYEKSLVNGINEYDVSKLDSGIYLVKTCEGLIKKMIKN